MRYVYFDHNATSTLDPRVREAMLPWLGGDPGNPSSAHRLGQAARGAVEEARRHVARLIGGEPLEVVFTASGSEANNAAIFETARRAGYSGELVMSTLEHPSVRRAAERCVEQGMTLREVAPGADGVVAAAAVLEALRPDTRLVCLMLANNELGTLQPVAEVAARCRGRGVPVLCDAVQAVGKMPVDVGELGADFVSLGGHKFHGPLGAAALWVRPEMPFEGHLVGGSQERGRRAGTVNVPAVVGLGTACALAAEELPERRRRLTVMRDLLEESIVQRLAEARIHCRSSPRLPHTCHVAFPGVAGQSLVIRLDLAGFAVSAGPACSSGTVEPSAALLSMGMPASEALASIRISLGITNTRQEVEAFLPVLEQEVQALALLAPSGEDG
ncbi:MAG TPA: cysteine desulfurase family protein [Thermoanaerobaculia bacterium]|nr:cysteine desulfurase family protein [Thermoanaerobaculia bacterium]